MFISIFLVIAIPLTILFVHSFNQSSALNEKQQQESASNAFQNLSSLLSQDFIGENNRSYTRYGLLNTVPAIGGNSRQISESFFFPDTAGLYCSFDIQNNKCRKGLVGHFQLTQSNELLTPFYPDTNSRMGKTIWENYTFKDEEPRRAAKDLIKRLLDSLDIHNEYQSAGAIQVLDSSSVAPTTTIIDQLWDNNSISIPSRTELTSEDEALTYIAETAKMDSASLSRLRLLIGNNKRVKTNLFKVKYCDEHMVFFREIAIGDFAMVQGFVVHQKTYLDYLLKNLPQEFHGSTYAVNLSLDGKIINTLGEKNNHRKIFEHDLQSPFQNISLQVYINKDLQPFPYSILITGFVLLLVIAICLITIYRFTRNNMALATKRQDFVSAITHELKTPLAAIKMYAELLQNSWVANEEKKQRYYNQIASEADRLSRLIQNVLNLSKLDGNRWNVQLRMERPKAVIDDFIATYSKNVEKQGFELTVSTDMEADKIHQLIDRDAIMQILMNLVDNSLKFSKNADYKMINIELAIKGTDMYMAVRDYGPGIPQSEMKKVFQEFYRVENEMTRQTSGTGIGLSMVKKLCNLCNMKIEVENANPGLRTKIHFKPLDL